MMISNSQIQALIAQYNKQDLKTANKNKTEASTIMRKNTDNIDVSNDAKAFLVAKQAIKNIPDVRDDRIAEIVQRVKTGTYEVKDEDVAEKIIGRSLVDELV